MRSDRNGAAKGPRAAASTDADAVRARYRANTARHLIGIARDFQERMLRRLTAAGHEDLRLGFGPPLTLVALSPRPLGALASALSISPQACSQLVSAAAAAGYAERRADPNDGRARVVALTAAGQRLVRDAGRVLRALSEEYAARIGADEMARFEEAIAALFEARGPRSEIESRPGPGTAIGLLPLLSVEVQQTLMREVAAHGHEGLKMAHAQVLPLIGPGGARVGALARVQRISRQAISATARELEGLGYLRREPDPRDGRGVVFQLTRQGEQLIEDSVRALDALDTSHAEAIGRARFAALERGALALYEALGLEREIFEANATRSAGLTAALSADGGEPLERLADRLRAELGEDDAQRLAALLRFGGGGPAAPAPAQTTP